MVEWIPNWIAWCAPARTGRLASHGGLARPGRTVARRPGRWRVLLATAWFLASAIAVIGQGQSPPTDPFQPWGESPAAEQARPGSSLSVGGESPRIESPRLAPWGTLGGQFGVTDQDAGFSARTDSFGQEIPWLHFPWLEPDRESRVGRHRGLGDPLEGTSWLNRPWHIGWMVGTIFADDLISGQQRQSDELVGGYRLGWDFDHYWGTEARFMFANPGLTDATDDTFVSTAQNHYFDASLLYYPWGDSRWRPFASLGVGWASFRYTPADGNRIDKALLELPYGVGVKYYHRNWLALRLSATDQWTIGQGSLNTMHNVAVTADVEVHFGGRRRSYFPYNSSIHLW